MSVPASRRTPTGSRRRSGVAGSSRHSHGDTSISSYSTASAKGNECIPTSRSQPVTPRRQVKHSTCIDNHGIRPPAPEQYLTPLQQKEVCIRHLRARLRENVERLQDRDVEIDELRGQLVRMQEDWIEEECHRVEAQMALKEARKEIRQLQHVVETVRTNLGTREPGGAETPHTAEPKSEGWYGARVGARPGTSRSCGCSPAHTMSRSATYTRLSTESPTSSGADRNGNVGSWDARAGVVKSKTLPRGDGRTHLLLEAALLTEQLPRCPSSMPRSSTYERLCSGETLLPVPVPHPPCCHHAVNNNCSCGAPHTYLPQHHHLFLHLPQEDAPPPPTIPPPPPPPPPQATAASPAPSQHQHPSSAPSESSEVSDRPGYRSQACSPTITWISEEGTGEDLSLITAASGGPIPTGTAADASLLLSEAAPFLSLSSPTPSSATPQPTCVDMAEQSPLDGGSSLELLPPASLVPTPTPQTQQPQARASPSPLAEMPPPLAPPTPQEVLVLEVSEEEDDVRSPLSGPNRDEGGNDDEDEDSGGQEPPQRCHWSRYFLVDLLAVAVPVVPAVAWLCRGARRPDLPVYPIGSLLRGCCAVALHSLRQVGRGRGRGRGSANTGGVTNI
ncbi:syntaphilin isoform X2 [Alosa sapidissima]|uniref:syntaphilin isoform X2 n=1 Tax=Alosa sapidissima TaxID=34773 RepID=UPI001C09EF02|nr:syntaphilin isoform X2 [Alosa sapidissima]